MKEMNVARGTARAARRTHGTKHTMPPPSAAAYAAAYAAMLVDQQRANRKLGVKLYHKSGHGVR